MRVGIYLGRPPAKTCPEFVYSRALIFSWVRALAAKQSEDELVFYGDQVMLNEELIKDASLGSVLTAEASELLYTGADRYFRELPNGARCRVLFRRLPSALPRSLKNFVDQLLLPLLLMLDKAELLHGTSGSGTFFSLQPQVITVHRSLIPATEELEDLPEQEKDKKRQKRPIEKAKRQSKLTRMFTRLQLKRATHVIAVWKEVEKNLREHLKLDAACISTIINGLDDLFNWSLEDLLELKGQTLVLEDKKIRSGFVLIFASLDSDFNLANNLAAWLELPTELQKRGLLVLCQDAAAKRTAERLLAEKARDESVFILPHCALDEVRYVLSQTGAALFSGLGQCYGLSALEAFAQEVPLVAGRLESLALHDSEKIFLCDPSSPQSIHGSLEKALLNEDNAPHSAAAQVSEAAALLGIRSATPRGSRRGALSCRTMQEACSETFSLYRELILRFKKR